jgi:glycosyltransferase involved in cell wall biosynthesis
MKIVYVTDRYAPVLGGVETHVQRLAHGAASAGHRVEVLTGLHETTCDPLEYDDGVVIRRFPLIYRGAHVSFSPDLLRYLGAVDCEIVHAHNYHSLTSLMAMRCSAPLVFSPHYHGGSADRLRSALHIPYRLAGRNIFRRAVRVICVSDAEAVLVTDQFPFVADKLTVISSGVDAVALAEAAPFSSPDAQGRRVILSAGRLEPYKQVDVTVRAMRVLGGDFCLKVAGDGPAGAALRALVSDQQVRGSTELLGHVSTSDLHRWFATAKVFVTLSRHEAQSIVVLQAIAAGCRVVASDIPAHRSVAASTGADVTFVPPGSSPALLAEAILSAAAGIPRHAVVPSWVEVTAQTLAVYGEARDCAAAPTADRMPLLRLQTESLR